MKYFTFATVSILLFLVRVSNAFISTSPKFSSIVHNGRHASHQLRSMQMGIDTKELFRKNVQMWKNFYTKDGMREFADSFAEDGKMFLRVDKDYELTGSTEILNFMQDWKVAYDIQDIVFSEPACSPSSFACTWTARWRAKASGVPGTTKGFVLALFDEEGKVKEYHDVMDKDEYEAYLSAAYVPQF